MDVLFENTYVRDKALAKEFYGYYYLKRKLQVFLQIMLCICFLANLILAILDLPYSVLVLITVPAWFLIHFVSYFSGVNAMVKRDREICGDDLKVTVIVTEDGLQIAGSVGGEIKIGFDKVKDVIQTKNLILVRSKARLVYILRKDSFSIGTKEALQSFLKDKGITIKGK
jgi:hypothetical protein